MGLALLGLVALAGCATTPKGQEAKTDLRHDVWKTVEEYQTKDPGMKKFLDESYAYAVFPSIGKGGLIVGGAYGQGEVFEQKKMVGYVTVSQASIGAQIGGQTFSELIVFQNKTALENLQANKLNFSANVSAVALKSGASAAANYRDGVVVFTNPNGGAMLEASVGGQKFEYQKAEMSGRHDKKCAKCETHGHHKMMDHDSDNSMSD